jgi:hypothetical protein
LMLPSAIRASGGHRLNTYTLKLRLGTVHASGGVRVKPIKRDGT